MKEIDKAVEKYSLEEVKDYLESLEKPTYIELERQVNFWKAEATRNEYYKQWYEEKYGTPYCNE